MKFIFTVLVFLIHDSVEQFIISDISTVTRFSPGNSAEKRWSTIPMVRVVKRIRESLRNVNQRGVPIIDKSNIVNVPDDPNLKKFLGPTNLLLKTTGPASLIDERCMLQGGNSLRPRTPADFDLLKSLSKFDESLKVYHLGLEPIGGKYNESHIDKIDIS